MSKVWSYCSAPLFAAAAATLAMAPVSQAATVFSDTFATSTLNSAAPAEPTATSTNYQVLSTKNATGSSIAPGSLQLNMGTTTSGFAEVQALFAGAPVNLPSAGDFIKLTATFTAAGLNNTLNVGLYNSGGSAPIPGTSLNNAQLDDDPGTLNTGGAAGWLGYAARIPVEGSASVIFTRPAQVGETSNEAQDVLFSNAGGGAFDNPAGTTVASGGTGETLAADTLYTLVYTITNNGGGGLDMSVDLNNGLATVGGTHAAPLTTGFDAFALGYRGSTNVAPGHSLNVSSLVIESNVVPEPASLGLLGLGGTLALRRRRA
jgi:hypothetical protein